MARLRPLDREQAPSSAGALLTEIIDRHGDAGPMVRAMAHSPAVPRGYLELSRAMKRVAVPRPLSEKISLAVQLRALGWSDRVLADVLGLVALNQLTGSFNLVACLEAAPTAPAA